MATRNNWSDRKLNQRILAYLKNGYDITVSQAADRFGISASTVSARISDLRKAGFAIYTNRKTFSNGTTSFVYRLGNPTRAQVAAGFVGLKDWYVGPIALDNLNLV